MQNQDQLNLLLIKSQQDMITDMRKEMMTLSEMLGQATKENNLLRQQLQHAYAELQAAQEKEDQPEVFLSLSQRPQSL